MSLRIEGEETLNATVSVGLRTEKFNIVSNGHGRTQECNFCVCLESKTPCICRFFDLLREIGARKYFTDHHTPNTINGFGDSVLVYKYTTVTVEYAKNFEQHVTPSY